jgi:hypothetical protein
MKNSRPSSKEMQKPDEDEPKKQLKHAQQQLDLTKAYPGRTSGSRPL